MTLRQLSFLILSGIILVSCGIKEEKVILGRVSADADQRVFGDWDEDELGVGLDTLSLSLRNTRGSGTLIIQRHCSKDSMASVLADVNVTQSTIEVLEDRREVDKNNPICQVEIRKGDIFRYRLDQTGNFLIVSGQNDSLFKPLGKPFKRWAL